MKSKSKQSGLPDLPLPIAIALVVIASMCFSNSHDGQFVFDDSEAIVNNEDVRDTPIFAIFKNDFWGTKLSHKQSHKSYRPLTILTFRLHFWLRGNLNPHDFHKVNIALHTAVSVLTLFVLNVLLGSNARGIAFYATVLFAVHPVHAEAVAGIVGRADVLCALFMWMSILFYHSSTSTKNSLTKWCSMGACISCITIAMLCKETGITAIGICGIYDIAIVNKIRPIDIINVILRKHSAPDLKHSLANKYRSLILRLIILCLAVLVLLLLRLSIMGFSTPTFQPVDNPASFADHLVIRVLNYNYIYCLNAWLMLCPEWLCFDWAMGCIPLLLGLEMRIFAIAALWFILMLFFVHICSKNKSKYSSYTIMGLTLLIVPFLPATNLFFNVGFVLAERTLYIPSTGFCLLIAIGLQRLSQHFPSSKMPLMLYLGLIVLFFARSWLRSDQWKTETALFRTALSVCPLNAKVHYNIAKNAADMGNTSYAELEYNEALRLNPDYAQAMNNLGNLLKDQNKYFEAEKLFKRAVELQEDFAAAWMNLGIVLSAVKKYEESHKSYVTALSHRPKYPDCYYNLGVLYLEQKHYDKALIAWENATRQKPMHKRAWTNTILLLDDLGEREKALSMGNRALKYLPEEASIHFNIANILGKTGKFVAAEKKFKIAISKDSTNPTFYTNLGVLYHRWNKLDKAEHMYRKALEMNPDLHNARDNLKKLKSVQTKIK